MEQEQRLSHRYRDFIISGGARVLTTRFFSLLYTYIVARLILKDDMGFLVILASTQAIMVLFSTYGLKFSAIHFGLGKRKVEGGGSLPFQVTLFIGLPTIILLTELVIATSELVFTSGNIFHPLVDNRELHLAFLFSNAMAILLEGIAACQVAVLKSDKEAGLRMFYSVTNSIFVPLAYYLRPEVVAVVWTWSILLCLTVLVGIRIHPQPRDLFRFRSKEIREIIQFGLAYNLTTLLVVLSGYYDQFVIFLNFSAEDLTDYYWPQRIAMIAIEAFGVVMTGLFPLLTKMEADFGRSVAIQRFRVMFKLVAYFSSIFFTGLLLVSDLAVALLLGSAYTISVTYLELFAIMGWFQSMNTLLRMRLNSYGSRRLVIYADIIAAVSRMTFITIGSLFMVEALIIAKILTFMAVSTYILSFRKFIGIGWSYTLKYVLIGGSHFLIGFYLARSIENIWVRLPVGLVVATISIVIAYRTNFIGGEERKLLKRIALRK